MTTTTGAGTVAAPGTARSRLRWVALGVVCTGALMNVLDTTIVGVALPAIRGDLGFSQASLAWVVNAYLLAYGGFLLLGGRLGDLYGHRRLFAAAIGVFTLASLACGLAAGQGFLLAARAVQGLGGAVASAVTLSLVVLLFPEPGQRAKAMGVYGLVTAGGGSIGVLLGGVLTGLLSWHWVFLVNVPIGAAVWLASLRVLPAGAARAGHGRVDVPGAVLVTAGMLAAVYAITGASQAGWASARTGGILAAAMVLLAAFAAVESRAAAPLIPLRLLRVRNLAAASVTAALWTAAMFAWFFLTTLYLQQVLGYSPLQTGLAFLPMNLVIAGLSAGAAARLVARFGIKPPLVGGLLLVAAGLALLGRAPVGGHFTTDVLPAGILLGTGAGTALAPLLLAATGDLPPADSGLASGIANTSFMLGGALGLAVLAGIATTRTDHLAAAGSPHLAALTGGYHTAFWASAACAAAAALLAATWLRPASAAGTGAATPAAEPPLTTPASKRRELTPHPGLPGTAHPAPGGPHREEEVPMAVVICDMSVSLDGYVTGPNDSRANPFGDGAQMLHDWMSGAATDEDRAVLHEFAGGVGAVVMGRKSFDKNEGAGGWGGGGPLGDTPCFVVTHNRPARSYPPVFTFVTDGVASAIGQARKAAGGKDVYLFGATVMQQALPLGLVDEIFVHLVPVLVGGGTPLFGALGSPVALERTQALATPAATHLRFRVTR